MKLRAPMAARVEAELPLKPMALSSNRTADPEIAAFMTRHSVQTLTPLYPGMVGDRKRRQVSSLQIAGEIRQRFAKRASRARAAFQPPDISRTYVADLAGAPADLARTLALLNADPDVEFAEEDKTVSTSYTPNDPLFFSRGSWGQAYDDLWGIKKIGAPTAWDSATGEGVVVAVVDTGVDYNHSDISANIWTNPGEVAGNGQDDDGNGYIDDVRGWNLVSGTNNPRDDNGHGTHVAGTIAAAGNNGTGVIGVAWRARVMAVKGLDSGGSGKDSMLAQGIVYAAANGADVINNSWGGPGVSLTIADAVDYAHNLGAVIVVAAGNDANDARFYHPAALWNVITVAASDPDDVLAGFSNWGSKIDVAAPGVDILSLRAAGTSLGTPVDSNYTRANGTSMAAPHVAGLAALILSAHPEYSTEEVRQALRVSAGGQAGADPGFGYGRINAAAAVAIGSALEAKISSPADGLKVRNPVQILGVARGSGFALYKLEYGAGTTPGSWTLLQSRSVPTSGELGTFDPSTVPNGIYTIRLTAFDTAGNAFADRIQLTAASAAITSPFLPNAASSAMTFQPGASIPILGSALATGFQQYQVDWAMGENPDSGWQTGGITLVNDGKQQVTNGALANWQTPVIAAASYYTIRLRVTGAALTNRITTLVYLEPDLMSDGWPKWFNPGPWWASGVVPGLNVDGSMRLVVASPYLGVAATTGHAPLETQHGALWTLPLDNAPRRTAMPFGYGSFSPPAVADLDGKPGDEVVVADLSGFRVFQTGGGSTGFNQRVGADFFRSPAVVEDLDGDSHWETIALGQDDAHRTAYVFAWRPDGSQLNGNFPIKIPDQNDQSGMSANRMQLTVGDIDGDGRKEIVVQECVSPETYTLRLFASDGSPKTWKVPVLRGIPYAMIAADLDGNGKLETIVVSYFGTRLMLHVFQPDGAERSGFPKLLLNPTMYSESYLAAGDLDRDGHKEIVLAHDTELYVFHSDGTPYSAAWPVEASGRGFGPVVIGDIDGDGFQEIVTTRNDLVMCPQYPQVCSDEKVIAIRRDGAETRSWQLTGMAHEQVVYPALTIGDFNQDGKTEIAVAYQVVDYWGGPISGVVTILRTGAPYEPSRNDWPMVYLNRRNSAVLGSASKPDPEPPCRYAISSGGRAFSATGGTGTVNVTTAAGCAWAASSSASWIAISGRSSGTGNGSVSFAVSPGSGGPRTGSMLVAGQPFLIEQQAASIAGLALAGSVPQVVPGGGWDTTLTLLNAGAAPVDVRWSFFDNSGRALPLPLSFPQQPTMGTLSGSGWDQTLGPNSMFVVDAAGAPAPAPEGSGELSASGAVSAFAILKHVPSGQEALVPAETRNAPSYWLAFDDAGEIGTGVALANLATQPANVRIVIRDEAGTQLGSDAISLLAQGHASFTLRNRFPYVAGHRGTLRLDAPSGGRISVLGLRTNRSALTTLPALVNETSGGGAMAQVVSGGAWQTTFTLVNTGGANASATLKFFNNQGTALQLPLKYMQKGTQVTAATVTQTITPGSSLVIATQGNETEATVEGSAQLTATGSITGFAIFRHTHTGQEAVVPLETARSSRYLLPFDNTDGLATGLALASALSRSVAISVTAWDDAGASLGTATVALPALGHNSFMLSSLLPAAANRRGTVAFESPSPGAISVLGLRATPAGAFTTVPVFPN